MFLCFLKYIPHTLIVVAGKRSGRQIIVVATKLLGKQFRIIVQVEVYQTHEVAASRY